MTSTVSTCRDCGADLDVRRRDVPYSMGGWPRVTLLLMEVGRCEACGVDVVAVPHASALNRRLAECRRDRDYKAAHAGDTWRVLPATSWGRRVLDGLPAYLVVVALWSMGALLATLVPPSSPWVPAVTALVAAVLAVALSWER